MMNVGAVGVHHECATIDDDTETSSELGGKTMTYFGSICLIVNNVTGPGMLVLPIMFQHSGWFVPGVMFVAVTLISAVSCCAICDAIARMPGNRNFDKRVEFATVFEHYLGRNWGITSQIFFCLCISASNIASIIAQAQCVDAVFLAAFGEAYAFQFTSSSVGSAFSFVSSSSGFADGNVASGPMITVGYVLSSLLVMPFGYWTLDENVTLQIISFWVMDAGICVFIWYFLAGKTIDGGGSVDFNAVPMLGSSYRSIIGTIMFNYACAVAIPSWLNEKQENVPVNKTIWVSHLIATLLYVLLGLSAAWAYNGDCPYNVLTQLSETPPPGDSNGDCRIATQVTALVWSFFMIGCGIPVFSILVRYNLYVAGVCSARWAKFWGVLFPWVVGWVFYVGSAFSEFVGWAALLLFGMINFIGPLLLDLYVIHQPVQASAPHVPNPTSCKSTKCKGSPRSRRASSATQIELDAGYGGCAAAELLSSSELFIDEGLDEDSERADRTRTDSSGYARVSGCTVSGARGLGLEEEDEEYAPFPGTLMAYHKALIGFVAGAAITLQVAAMIVAVMGYS
eukprot:TRINITY_DN5749_c0_g3_i1.p1 TRINITY_DN5749_c0_g3~~TRINITY_DN5749_c0_g3_i1.p1  ORF type:complete len:567 (+),score=113.34 TRINITY_DN5749_c0_g3_i1:206-1906(+)